MSSALIISQSQAPAQGVRTQKEADNTAEGTIEQET